MDNLGAVRHVRSSLGHRVKTTVCVQRYGYELLVLHIEGCDSVVGFKAKLGKVIKIVKISESMGDDDELEKLVRKIRSEVMAKPMNVDYKLSDYVHHKVIESTSATLLRLVSSLVSGGEITKPSLTLAQLVHSAAC